VLRVRALQQVLEAEKRKGDTVMTELSTDQTRPGEPDVPYTWPRGSVVHHRAARRVRNFWIVLSIALFLVLVAAVVMMAAYSW
jgi:hypothetical protein